MDRVVRLFDGVDVVMALCNDARHQRRHSKYRQSPHNAVGSGSKRLVSAFKTG